MDWSVFVILFLILISSKCTTSADESPNISIPDELPSTNIADESADKQPTESSTEINEENKNITTQNSGDIDVYYGIHHIEQKFPPYSLPQGNHLLEFGFPQKIPQTDFSSYQPCTLFESLGRKCSPNSYLANIISEIVNNHPWSSNLIPYNQQSNPIFNNLYTSYPWNFNVMSNDLNNLQFNSFLNNLYSSHPLNLYSNTWLNNIPYAPKSFSNPYSVNPSLYPFFPYSSNPIQSNPFHLQSVNPFQFNLYSKINPLSYNNFEVDPFSSHADSSLYNPYNFFNLDSYRNLLNFYNLMSYRNPYNVISPRTRSPYSPLNYINHQFYIKPRYMYSPNIDSNQLNSKNIPPFLTSSYNYINRLPVDPFFRMIFKVLITFLAKMFPRSGYFDEQQIYPQNSDILRVSAIISDVLRNFQTRDYASYWYEQVPKHPYYSWIFDKPEYLEVIKLLNDFVDDEYEKIKINQGSETSGWLYPEDLRQFQYDSGDHCPGTVPSSFSNYHWIPSPVLTWRQFASAPVTAPVHTPFAVPVTVPDHHNDISLQFTADHAAIRTLAAIVAEKYQQKYPKYY